MRVSKRLVTPILLVLTLVACTSENAQNTTTTSAAPLEIVIVDGLPVGGMVSIEVEVGDRVEFFVTSDTEDELHVHGFDHYYDLQPGVPTPVSFVADTFGIFEIELHGPTHAQIVELTVR